MNPYDLDHTDAAGDDHRAGETPAGRAALEQYRRAHPERVAWSPERGWHDPPPALEPDPEPAAPVGGLDLNRAERSADLEPVADAVAYYRSRPRPDLGARFSGTRRGAPACRVHAEQHDAGRDYSRSQNIRRAGVPCYWCQKDRAGITAAAAASSERSTAGALARIAALPPELRTIAERIATGDDLAR